MATPECAEAALALTAALERLDSLAPGGDQATSGAPEAVSEAALFKSVRALFRRLRGPLAELMSAEGCENAAEAPQS